MVSESAKLIGITKRVGYIWQDRPANAEELLKKVYQ
jgi:hypothetical protein